MAEIKTWQERIDLAIDEDFQDGMRALVHKTMQDEINELRAALAERVPLTREQIHDAVTDAGYVRPKERADFINGMRHCEIAHGITTATGEQA